MYRIKQVCRTTRPTAFGYLWSPVRPACGGSEAPWAIFWGKCHKDCPIPVPAPVPCPQLVSQVCHCWCRPFSAGDATFLLICFPGLSLLVSALSAGHAAFLFICFPGLTLVLPPFSAGHAAFLFICFAFQGWCLHCCFLPCPLERFLLLCKGCVTVGHCISATLCNFVSCSGNRWMNDRIGFRPRGSDLCSVGAEAYVRHQKSMSCHILRSSCFCFLSSRGQLSADRAA